MAETILTFIPETGKDYLAVISRDAEEELDFVALPYQIVVEETNKMPASRPGERISGTLDHQSVTTLDSYSYNLNAYKLAGAPTGAPFYIELSSPAEEIHAFVFDASDWEILLDFVPGENGPAGVFIPKEGKQYFIGVGVFADEADVPYTLNLRE